MREKEHERAGLVPPKAVRESLQKPFAEHLRDFVANLRGQGRDARYIRGVQNALLALAAEKEGLCTKVAENSPRLSAVLAATVSDGPDARAKGRLR